MELSLDNELAPTSDSLGPLFLPNDGRQTPSNSLVHADDGQHMDPTLTTNGSAAEKFNIWNSDRLPGSITINLPIIEEEFNSQGQDAGNISTQVESIAAHNNNNSSQQLDSHHPANMQPLDPKKTMHDAHISHGPPDPHNQTSLGQVESTRHAQDVPDPAILHPLDQVGERHAQGPPGSLQLQQPLGAKEKTHASHGPSGLPKIRHSMITR
ncbi:hypothetical protein MRB53_033106 [Persea americana]|uniref:Uncharacterized protein n=1 Tax=Persea americana TaxID=3435 RepID=A0ACC2KUP0_PERAE|nr:hypothetical protein MRB53_033106 [Persea americana]